jgi:hypothetical protein
MSVCRLGRDRHRLSNTVPRLVVTDHCQHEILNEFPALNGVGICAQQHGG